MRSWILKISLILLVVLFLWAWLPSLSVGFLADDYEWFVHIRDLPFSQVWKIFWPQALGEIRFVQYRPLVGLSLWVDYRLWGLNPFGYHLTNLVLHLLTGVGVGLLAKIIREMGDSSKKSDGSLVGVLVSVLFLVNPLFTEAVTWISGRHDVLATGLIVWSLVLFSYGLRRKKKRSIYWTVSLLFSFLSLLSKEIAVTVPIFISITSLYYVVHTTNSIGNTILSDSKTYLCKKWILAFVAIVILVLVFGEYALAKPLWMMQGNYSLQLARPFLLWVVMSIFYVFYKYINKERLRLGKKLLIWVFLGISFLPVAFFPTQLRFLYFPTVFLSILVVFGVFEFKLKRRVGTEIVGVLLLLSVVFSFFLRMSNLSWVRASDYHKQAVFEMRMILEERKPSVVYVFNLPDHIGRVPVFRSYVPEAVRMIGSFQGSVLDSVKIVVGPTPRDLSGSSVLIDANDVVKMRSESGFVVFEPTVVDSYGDGSLRVDWKGEWEAKISADRREALVKLPQALDDEGVLGLVFDQGEIREL